MKSSKPKLTRAALFTLITLMLIPSSLVLASQNALAAWDITVFQDKLSNGWQNWSWGSSVNTSNTSVHYSDSHSISYTPNNGWAALYLHNDSSLNIQDYWGLQFQVRATENNEKFQIIFYDSNNSVLSTKINLSDYGGQTVKDKWVEYNIPFSKITSTSKIKGFAIQESSGHSQPTVYLDNIYIKVSGTTGVASPAPAPSTPETTPTPAPTNPTQEPTTNPTPVPAPEPTPTPVTGTGVYTTSNGKIFQNGSAIKLKGVNWFGFEGGTKVVHGLWARNYKDMVSQMKSLGFNAVRIPYCPSTVDGVSTTSVNYDLNPDLQGLNSLQILDKIVREISNQKMYVLLDNHNPDCNAISDLWYSGSYSESHWISDLKALATKFKDVPYFIGLDIKNEPKGSATWGTGNTSTDFNLAAERAGKGILSVNPNILIFVEGVSSNPVCSGNTGHFWGGNLEPVACSPINAASIPANKLVYAPHVYGPDVAYQSYFDASNFPANMPAVWNTHFGYLADKGYTIAPTEWGGKYGNGGQAKDVTWQNALVSYFKSKKICNSFYWDWNPNSGDTGGILKDDWKTPWQNKVDLLNGYYSGCSQ